MLKWKVSAGAVLGLLLVSLVVFQSLALAAAAELTGVWEGKLEFAGTNLRIVFRIDESADGSYQAVMDSPDQGVTDIPVSGVTVEGDQIAIEVGTIQASFRGKMSPGGEEIDGVWSQGQANLPMTLRKGTGVVENNRPQEPQPPFPYRDNQVSYLNESAGVKLAGTLTLPEGEGPFPAVLLITGSGSQDRDENIMGHKPFMVIADYLTRRGIAVLRVDDRGVGGSTGNPMTATSADLAGDVLAGVNFLKGHPEIAGDEIGLIGHSEGGLIAPMVAVKSEDVAFIVLMAGTGIPGGEILERQVGDILRSAGSSEEKIAREVSRQREIGRIISEIKDDDEAAAQLRPLLEEAVAEMGESDKALIKNSYGSLEDYYQKSIEMVLLPWYRYFISYDPRPTLREVDCPVLAINGSKDTQVAAGINLSAIEKALKEGGNDDVTIRELPGLNHLFQECVTGNPDEYAAIEETISPQALQLMGDWILDRVGE